MTSRVTEGGCLCRAVRYRVNGVPIVTSLCHCRTCRLAAGAPSVAWVVLLFEGLHVFRCATRPLSFVPRCNSHVLQSVWYVLDVSA